MYIADTELFWINDSEHYPDGSLKRDLRREISREQLVAHFGGKVDT